jgi:hypothetical protein
VTAADVIHFVAAGVLAMTGSVLVAAGGLVSGVVAPVCAAALCVRVYRRYQEYRRSAGNGDGYSSVSALLSRTVSPWVQPGGGASAAQASATRVPYR